MKARILFLAVLTVLSLTACKKVDPAQLYKDSFTKAAEMESYSMESHMEMELDFADLQVSINIQSDVADKGETAVHDLTITSLGESQSSVIYQKDDFLYSSIPDSDQYLKQSLEEGSGLSYQSLMDTSGESAQLYVDAIDSAENLTVTEENGSTTVSFDFSATTLEALTEGIVSNLQESMMSSLEESLSTQLEGMGLSGSDLEAMTAQLLEVYQTMFSKVTVEGIHMEKTMNDKGFCTEQDMTMSLNMDLSELLAALGENLDAESAEQMKTIGLDLSMKSNYSNINEAMELSLPEFTEENTVTE